MVDVSDNPGDVSASPGHVPHIPSILFLLIPLARYPSSFILVYPYSVCLELLFQSLFFALSPNPSSSHAHTIGVFFVKFPSTLLFLLFIHSGSYPASSSHRSISAFSFPLHQVSFLAISSTLTFQPHRTLRVLPLIYISFLLIWCLFSCHKVRIQVYIQSNLTY